MEELEELSPPQAVPLEPESQERSLWRQSTTPAVALTLLATCGIAINVHNPIEALGNMLFTVPVTFFFWWLVCTFLFWLWQTLFGRG